MPVHGSIQLLLVEAAGRRLPSRASTAFITVNQNRAVRHGAPQSRIEATTVSCQESTAQLTHTPASTSDSREKPSWPPAWAAAPAVSILPISRDVQRILQALQDGPNLVLEAPPGAGKTTLVPLAVLEGAASWLQPNATILVVEPRRLAARAAAQRMADLLGEPVGERVGYRVRLDSCTGPRTRIEVVTTGILLHRLQADPQLRGVGAVMLDEFHERGWQSDLIFALCLASQRQGRADLRMVIMSATISAQLQQRLTQQLGNPAIPKASGASTSQEQQGELSFAEEAGVTIISCNGRSYPVKTVYLGSFAQQDLCKAAEAAIHRALKEQNGGILCFLPGRGEVVALQRALSASASTQLAVLPLYGDLSREEQDRVMRSPDDGVRRVVLATPIAESSLTVPGVSVVVDCGFVRKPWYDAATSLERLRQTRISQASAAQRQGRAGRTQPGICYRLYSEAMHASLAPDTQPEILSTDPWPLALQLAAWHTHRSTSHKPPPATFAAVNHSCSAHDPPNGPRQEVQLAATPSSIRSGDGRGGSWLESVVGGLPWLDDPPKGLLQAASQGLAAVGALDDANRLTEAGWRMAALGMHPRLARMLLLAESLGMPALGATLAAMLEERDFVQESGADIWLRLKALASSPGVQSAAMQRIGQLVKQSLASLRSTSSEASIDSLQAGRSADSSLKDNSVDPRLALGLLVASAYPDRIAQRKERGNRSRAAFMLASGETARLPNELDPLNDCEYLAVASLGGNNLKGNSNTNIFLAAPLVITAVQEHLPHLTSSETTSYWAPTSKSVMGRSRTRIGQVVIEEELSTSLADEEALSILIAQLRSARKLPLPPEALRWQQRVQWLRQTSLSALACNEDGDTAAEGQTDGKGQPQDGSRAARSNQEALLAARNDCEDAVVPVVGSPQAQSTSVQPGCSPQSFPRQGRQPSPADSAAQRRKKAKAAKKGGQHRSLVQQDGVPGNAGGGFSSAELAAFRESVGAEDAAELLQLPDVSNEGLLGSMEGWLKQHLIGLRSWREVQALPWEELMRSRCSAKQLAVIDSLAPPSVQLTPTQPPAHMDYTRSLPRLSLPLHDLIGVEALRYSVANGTLPVLFGLLSPKGEEMASCFDLAEFWKSQYANLRKGLRSKYPKVNWP